MLGKTFKGMTDEMLVWQTQKLRELAIGEDDWTVHVRPELVVEIAYSDLQASPRYPGGLALRFARVKRYRTDKRAEDADTIATVRALYARAASSSMTSNFWSGSRFSMRRASPMMVCTSAPRASASFRYVKYVRARRWMAGLIS